MWLFDLLFSSRPQLRYVEALISRSVSESPLEFEITRVDCINTRSTTRIEEIIIAVLPVRLFRFSFKVNGYIVFQCSVQGRQLLWLPTFDNSCAKVQFVLSHHSLYKGDNYCDSLLLATLAPLCYLFCLNKVYTRETTLYDFLLLPTLTPLCNFFCPVTG